MPATTKTKSIEWWVKHCLADRGYAEQPLGSNRTKFGKQFGWDGVAWCAEAGWCWYQDAGVTLPIKSASCVAIWDYCVQHGLTYTSDHCVPGDSVIRTWTGKGRNEPGFNAAETHYQEVLEVKHVGGVKYLGLWGGNQGAGYVGPELEWVRAGDSSILGGLAFHRLFASTMPPLPQKTTGKTKANLPAAKSHSKPDYRPLKVKARENVTELTKSLEGSARPVKGNGDRSALRRLLAAIKARLGRKATK